MELQMLGPSLILGEADCQVCGRAVPVKTNKNRWAYAFCSHCGHNIRTTSMRACETLVRQVARFKPGMEKHVREVFPLASKPAGAAAPPTVKPKPAPPRPAVGARRATSLPWEEE